MNTIQTASPALQDAETLQSALDEIREVFLRRAIDDRCQQMATAVTFLALSISEAVSISDEAPADAAAVLVDTACLILRREVATAVAEIGRPN